MNKPIELTNEMTQQERIAAQNTNNAKNGTLINRVEKNETELNKIIESDNPIIGGKPIKPTVLWSGAWSAGSINVNNIEKYTLLIVEVSKSETGLLTSIICTKNVNGTVNGMGGYASGQNTHITIGVSFNCNGDTLNYGSASLLTHASGSNHPGSYNVKISKIIGIA